MIRIVAGIRYSALAAVICSFAGALLVFVAGAVKVYKAVAFYFAGEANVIRVDGTARVVGHLTQEDALIARIVESIDAFLIALVLLYFGYGIYALFCAGQNDRLLRALPRALVPSSLGELKESLVHVILVVLVVLFTRLVWLHLDDLHWELLVLPGAIVLLAAGLRLARPGRHDA